MRPLQDREARVGTGFRIYRRLRFLDLMTFLREAGGPALAAGLGCGFLFLPGMVVPHFPQKLAVKGKGLWHCKQFITGSLVLLDVI